MSKKKTKEIILDDNNSVLVEQKTIPDKKPRSLMAKGGKISKQALAIRKNKAKQLLLDGNTISAVAKSVKLSMHTVNRVLKTDLNMTLEDLKHFKENKSEYLELAQTAFLRSALDAEKLLDMPSKDAIKSFETLNKLNRLANGQSTSNVSVHAFINAKQK